MTIAELLHGSTSLLAAITDDARLEAELLLAQALGVDRAHLIARLQDDIDGGDRDAFARLLARRLRREPLAYIVGRREFFGIEVRCSPAALIPRPETEMLVSFALTEIERLGAAARVPDIGTGSGAIAIAIAANARSTHVLAIDASAGAIDLARFNASSAGVIDRVDFHEGDLLEGMGVFDVVVANLPYINESAWAALAPEIRDHEPRGALVAGPQGTEAIERLLAMAPAHLTPGAAIALEIGDVQASVVLRASRLNFPEADICVKKDLAGLDRMLAVRLQGG